MNKLPQELRDTVLSYVALERSVQVVEKECVGYRFFQDGKRLRLPTYMGDAFSVDFLSHVSSTHEFVFGTGHDMLPPTLPQGTQQFLETDHYGLQLFPKQLVLKVKIHVGFEYFRDAESDDHYGESQWTPNALM